MQTIDAFNLGKKYIADAAFLGLGWRGKFLSLSALRWPQSTNVLAALLRAVVLVFALLCAKLVSAQNDPPVYVYGTTANYQPITYPTLWAAEAAMRSNSHPLAPKLKLFSMYASGDGKTISRVYKVPPAPISYVPRVYYTSTTYDGRSGPDAPTPGEAVALSKNAGFSAGQCYVAPVWANDTEICCELLYTDTNGVTERLDNCTPYPNVPPRTFEPYQEEVRSPTNGVCIDPLYSSPPVGVCPSGWRYEDSCFTTPRENLNAACWNNYFDIIEVRIPKEKCEETSVGNPINTGTGAKTQIESDFSAGISLKRYYNSRWFDQADRMGEGWTHSFSSRLTLVPSSSYVIVHRPGGAFATFQSTALNSGDWVTEADTKSRLSEIRDAQNARTGWKYYDADTENVETFLLDGRLSAITTRAGIAQTMTYEASPVPSIRARITEVTDSFGRKLVFTYRAGSPVNGAYNVATVSDANGNVVTYDYDANNNLISASYQSSGTKTYHYNEPANTGGTNLPSTLTGITDENGTRYATFKYDSFGRAISTEHAGGTNKYAVEYLTNFTQSRVTDPNNTQRTYSFQPLLGVTRTSAVSQPCTSCGGANSLATTYDANGNVASRADFNNKKTCHTYDLARNLETARVEGLPSSATCSTELAKAVTAFTAADQKKVQTQWHATYRLPLTITEPAAATTVGGTPGTKLTEFTYDAAGNMLTRKVTAPKNDGTGTTDIRTWTYSYNGLGQVLTAKDPANQTTITVYYAATDTANPPKWTKGDVQTITSAAGHVVTFNEYDRNGRATKMTDANGLITTMAYHPRGWLSSRSVNNGTTVETTLYTYDNVGQLTKVTLPDGANLFYAYDAAHRLVGMSDQLINATPAANGALIVNQTNLAGNKIVYSLDNMGNRIKEEHFDPSNTLAKKKQRAIDALNRLKQDIGGTSYAAAAPAGAPALDASVSGAPANAAITQYGYDNNGNLTSTLDALGRSTTNEYDALNRLTKVIDPYNGTTKPTIYQYDQSNNLVQVTDPQGLQTKYTYNGHNNLIAQQSPDTGATKFKYNAMGNVVAKIDSVNRCTTTAYDNLHRPTSIKYYAATNASTNTQTLCFGTIAGTVVVEETHTYTYDSITATLGGPGGKGRVSRVADAAGRVDYVYDLNGRITSKTNVLTGATNPNRTITYQYSNNGQLRSMTTPSGQTIAYTYGAPSSANPGKIIALTLNPTGYTATSEGGNIPTGGINILTSADYKPFGPNEGWDWGNTCTGSSTTCNTTSNPLINQHLRAFDLDYRPITIGNDPQGYSRNIAWDRANRITAITTPSGATIPGIVNANSLNQAFAYDQLDRLTQFNAGSAGATTLAAGMALLPTEQFSYDAIGNRLTRTTTAPGTSTNQTANYAYPNLSTTSGTKSHTLTGITGANAWTYAYDASGNTIKEGTNIANAASTQYTLTYDAKNRLNKTQIGTNAADFVTYKINAMGQRVQKTGAGTYAYNAATASSFAFNARFVYDESGNLIGEYAPDGKLISETVWFNGMPIATLRPKGSNSGTPLGITGTTTGNPANGATAANANNAGNNTTTNRVNVEIFYVHSDHLGTPRVVTRSTIATGANAPSSATSTSPGSINKSVWMWNSDPFGTMGPTGAGGSANSAPNKNPQLITGAAAQIAAGTFEQNLRMPGQFEDQETKSFYNYFRDYDPAIGRYKSSDPIGLGGGLNTFGYALSQPCRLSDPRGLFSSGADYALMAHFWIWRAGGYVDISAWCADYLGDMVISARTNGLKQKVDHKLREYAGFKGTTSFSIKQSGEAYVTGIFSFGKGGVRTENADCTVVGDGCCVKATCTLRHYAYDRFDDPRDICEKHGFCGDVRNLGGVPFDFGLSCNGGSFNSQYCK
jgi:RHS repeat-associated protein